MLSIPHLIVIFIVALIVFGPEKIPELARNLGKVMAEFRRATGDLRNTFETHLRDLEREADQHRISAAASAVSPAPSPSTEPPPIAPAPGIVPASAPNELVIASGGYSLTELAPDPVQQGPAAQDPAVVNPELQDPFLFGMALDPSVGRPPREEQSPASETEPNPEQVSDGHTRPA
jgi:sec-independent protein translocase protein TatB